MKKEHIKQFIYSILRHTFAVREGALIEDYDRTCLFEEPFHLNGLQLALLILLLEQRYDFRFSEEQFTGGSLLSVEGLVEAIYDAGISSGNSIV